MERELHVIILILLSILEVWMCYQVLYRTVLEKNDLRKWQKMTIWANILVVGTLLGINRKILFFSITMFVFVILITLLCVWIVEKKNMLIKIEIITLFYTIFALMDFFCGFIGMEIISEHFFTGIYKFSQSIVQCVLFLIPRAGAALFLAKWKEKSLVLKKDRKMLAFLCIVFLGILRIYTTTMINMVIGARTAQGWGAAVSMVFVSALTAGVFLFFNRFQMLKRENKILLELETMSRNHVKDLEIMMEKNRIQIHDMKNHLLILREYEKEQQWELLSKYLDELAAEFQQGARISWTHINTLDMVLNQKKALAEERGIEFRMEETVIGSLPFTDTEICALFGNLLDNAIEACEKMKSDQKWIEVRFWRKSQMLDIMIANSIEKRPVEKRGKLVSDKADQQMHGYGEKSVRRIVEKYHGEYSYEIQDNVFSVRISFSYLKE